MTDPLLTPSFKALAVPMVYHVHQHNVVMNWINSYGMEYAFEAWKRG